jgi:large subunit ribosomal protein L7e
LKDLQDRRVNEKKERTEKRKQILANAEKYHSEYEKQTRSVTEAKRTAKAAGNFFVEAEPKLAFVIRIRG